MRWGGGGGSCGVSANEYSCTPRGFYVNILYSGVDRHRFRFDADPDPNPDPDRVPSFTHVGKQNFYFLFFILILCSSSAS